MWFLCHKSETLMSGISAFIKKKTQRGPLPLSPRGDPMTSLRPNKGPHVGMLSTLSHTLNAQDYKKQISLFCKLPSL